MAGTTYIENVSLTTIHCGVCAGTYAINDRYRKQCQEEGKSWHCPYCQTGWGYPNDNDNDKLKKKNEDLERSLQRARESRDNALAEATHFRKSRDGVRGVLAKQKKRIANGVCPCCKRNFTNLQRHMAHQHPDFTQP